MKEKSKLNTTGGVQVSVDGIIDYPLYRGQQLDGIWQVNSNSDGPSVTPNDGYLRYFVNNQQKLNQWSTVAITTPMQTIQGALLTFRIRVNRIQNTSEVKLGLPSGVILRFTNNGENVYWQWYNGSFQTLATSTISADGNWHQVTIAFTPNAISLFENGSFSFNWATTVGSQINPQFDMQLLDTGGSLSIDIGDIYSIPSVFAPGLNTPWDYAFSAYTTPMSEAMTFRQPSGGPQVSFYNGYARFSAMPQTVTNAWTYLDAQQNAPAQSIIIYRIRVNQADGYETKITLPGNNILRLLNSGSSASWVSWGTGGFQTLAQSSMTASQSNFGVVTLITNPTGISLLENGVYKYTQTYSPAVSVWSPSMAVQHYDQNNVSIDLGGIRTFPSIKTPTLLGSDLSEDLLGYFPLKGSLTNAAGNSTDLVATGPTSYVQGKFGLAYNFSGSSTVLQLPRMSSVTSTSYTVSAWVNVNNYPPTGQLTGIAGTLLLDSDGKLNFNFLYNAQRVYQSQILKSAATISKGNWHNVIVTYSFEESRLGIFINGKIDSLYYLQNIVASSSAILPSIYYLGASKLSFDQNFIVLDGAVGDVMFLTQHVHQPTINILANINPTPTAVPVAVLPLFFYAVYGVVRLVIDMQYISQTQPTPPLTLAQLVDKIRSLVGVPAGNRKVSRADLGIDENYRILLDVGGEGRLDNGITTGFAYAINLNAVLSGQGTPKVSTGIGPNNLACIPNLVQLAAWDTKPSYPFVDNFADEIVMIGAPLTPTNVQEIARVIRNKGEINLWIDYISWKDAVSQLAKLVNSSVETPPEIEDFKNNGLPENRKDERGRQGTWAVRQRIIANKPSKSVADCPEGVLPMQGKRSFSTASTPDIRNSPKNLNALSNNFLFTQQQARSPKFKPPVLSFPPEQNFSSTPQDFGLMRSLSAKKTDKEPTAPFFAVLFSGQRQLGHHKLTRKPIQPATFVLGGLVEIGKKFIGRFFSGLFAGQGQLSHSKSTEKTTQPTAPLVSSAESGKKPTISLSPEPTSGQRQQGHHQPGKKPVQSIGPLLSSPVESGEKSQEPYSPKLFSKRRQLGHHKLAIKPTSSTTFPLSSFIGNGKKPISTFSPRMFPRQKLGFKPTEKLVQQTAPLLRRLVR